MSDDKSTVLVVDDVSVNIEVMIGILEIDYVVKFALNGEKALEIATKEPQPDIILLDIMMPGMNGYEVCTKLKQDVSTSNIPVIFVTAFDDLSGEVKGFEVGGVDYITKPVVPEIVLARVNTHLKLKEVTEKLAEYALRMEKLADNKLDLDSPDP